MKITHYLIEVNVFVISLMFFIISHMFSVIVFYVGERYAIYMFFPVEIAFMVNLTLYTAIILQLIGITILIYNKLRNELKNESGN